MATYGDMQNRIKDELGGRTDLAVNQSGLSSSPIQFAIMDAIAYWENNRYWFNELRTASAFSTVLGQEFYTSADWSEIPNLLEIDKLSILVSANRYFMVGRTAQYMEDISVSTQSNGLPIDYSYYDEQLRFYPIPNGAYPINVLATKKFPALSATGDTNVWTTEAEQLIRATAKWFLLRDTIQDPVNAGIQERVAVQQDSNLSANTFGRIATRRVTGTFF